MPAVRLAAVNHMAMAAFLWQSPSTLLCILFSHATFFAILVKPLFFLGCLSQFFL